MIYKRTDWGYTKHRNNGEQIGAGIGMAEPYGVTFTVQQRRMWRKRGIAKD